MKKNGGRKPRWTAPLIYLFFQAVGAERDFSYKYQRRRVIEPRTTKRDFRYKYRTEQAVNRTPPQLSYTICYLCPSNRTPDEFIPLLLDQPNAKKPKTNLSTLQICFFTTRFFNNLTLKKNLLLDGIWEKVYNMSLLTQVQKMKFSIIHFQAFFSLVTLLLSLSLFIGVFFYVTRRINFLV